MLFPDAGIAQRFPAGGCELSDPILPRKGVEVLANERVNGMEGAGERLTVLTESGRRIDANGVVAGIGINRCRAGHCCGAGGRQRHRGNRALQTSHVDVFAAGDVANFYDGVLAGRRRVEHEDNANLMGRAAGAMAGADMGYDKSPMFYSDLFDLAMRLLARLIPAYKL